VKAARVLDLYAGIWDSGPPGENDYVICADEKTSIQARCRCHPTLPPGKARAMRVQHDCQRRGALAYLAAWDVHRGQVTGRCEHTTGITPFTRLVDQVMTAEPYASADRVFWIAGQRVFPPRRRPGQTDDQGLAERAPDPPARACLLAGPGRNHPAQSHQPERFHRPSDPWSLGQIRDRLAAFETSYNAIARPFRWKLTRIDLDDLLHRIGAHDRNPAPRSGSLISTPTNLRARPLRSEGPLSGTSRTTICAARICAARQHEPAQGEPVIKKIA
jgi:hypothetical protein